MTKKIFAYFMVAILEFSFVVMPITATAQTLTGSPLAAINKITAGTGSYSNGNVSAVYNELIRRASGQVVPIATSASVAVSASRMAGVAAAAMKAASVAGIASIVLPLIWDASGLRVCAPPDFICKIDPADVVPPVAVGGWKDSANGVAGPLSSAQSVCDQRFINMALPSSSLYVVAKMLSANTAQCPVYRKSDNSYYGGIANPSSPNSGTCSSGFHLVGSDCISDVEHIVPAVEADISTKLVPKLSDYSITKRLYDSLKVSNNPHYKDDAVTVVAPPVTLPSVGRTEQIINPDGTTSTKVTTAISVVNPLVTGTTINNTNISYPVTTTTTTTVTNNSTNVVTTTTTTDKETADKPPATDIPTDYNREATQQKILDELAGGTAVAPVDDSKTKMAASDLELKNKFEALPGQLMGDKANWFSWVWTPPTGSCAANTGVMHGFTVTFDLCPWVEKIRDAVGWLWAMIGAIYVYNLMFRSENG